jgi:hypothetical protein
MGQPFEPEKLLGVIKSILQMEWCRGLQRRCTEQTPKTAQEITEPSPESTLTE